jgi:hypothetical protein
MSGAGRTGQTPRKRTTRRNIREGARHGYRPERAGTINSLSEVALLQNQVADAALQSNAQSAVFNQAEFNQAEHEDRKAP